MDDVANHQSVNEEEDDASKSTDEEISDDDLSDEIEVDDHLRKSLNIEKVSDDSNDFSFTQ